MQLNSCAGLTQVSRGCCRRSDGQYVLSGVPISIMFSPTLLTRPAPHLERHLVRDVSTRAASFGGGEEAVDLDEFSSVPRRFVFELADDFAPRRVSDGPGKRVVLARRYRLAYHVLHGQRLGYNCLVLADELRRELVNEVAAPVTGAGVDAGYPAPRLTPVVRPLATANGGLLSGEVPLCPLELAEVAAVVLRVRALPAVRGCHEVRDAEVDPHGLLRRGQLLDLLFAKERDVIPPR